MKFALFSHIPWPEGTDQSRILEELTEQVQCGEELGFYSAWLAEHHFTRYGLGSSSLVLASNIAARTKTIRLGTGVLVPALHHPIQLAEDTAMLDRVSGGRLDVGVGRGSGKYEFAGFGVDQNESQQRFRQGIEIIEGLWTQPEFSYEGEYYKIYRVTVVPSPVQKPHPPVFVGATRTLATLEFAGRSGHLIMVGAVPNIPDAIQQCRHFLTHAASAGHDYSIGQIPFFRYFYVAETEEQAREDTRRAIEWQEDMIQWRSTIAEGSDVTQHLDDFRQARTNLPTSFEEIYTNRAFFGTPDYCAAKIEALRREGIDYFGCQFAFGGMEHAKIMRSMELFAKEVMPQFV